MACSRYYGPRIARCAGYSDVWDDKTQVATGWATRESFHDHTVPCISTALHGWLLKDLSARGCLRIVYTLASIMGPGREWRCGNTRWMSRPFAFMQSLRDFVSRVARLLVMHGPVCVHGKICVTCGSDAWWPDGTAEESKPNDCSCHHQVQQ